MEKLKPKHDHKLTEIIKVGMFALVLLLPFLVFLPNGLYYGFNEHAQLMTQTPSASYTTDIEYQYQYQTNNVEDWDDVVINRVYYWESLSFLAFSDTAEFDLEIIKGTFDNYDDSKFDKNDQYLGDYTANLGNRVYLYYYCDVGDTYFSLNFSNGEAYIDIGTNQLGNGYIFNITNCYLIINSNTNLQQFKYYCYETDQDLPTASDYLGQIINATADVNVTIDYEDTTITNAVYKGWQETWETPLFNWTSNSILNTGLTAFCNGLGISNQSMIPNFLTYELVIMAIYVILDIVITLFKWLTHIGQRE